MTINKRQAKFIMQLPDGYEWQFINDNRYIAGFKDQSVLVYEIVDEKLVQCTINHVEDLK